MESLQNNQHQRNVVALTLIEVLVVIVVLGILVMLFLPAISRPHVGMSIHCASNLKQIGLSFRMWAGDNGDKYPMSVSITNGGTMELVSRGHVFPHYLVMSNELNDPKILICPKDSKRTAATNFGTDFRDNTISYFVGVDAEDIKPTMFLAGDRNLEIDGTELRHGINLLTNGSSVGWTSQIHKTRGNVAFPDGSVQWDIDTKNLRLYFQTNDLATNRLAIP